MKKTLSVIFAMTAAGAPAYAAPSSQISTWSLYPDLTIKASRTLPFQFSATGVKKPILWGFDTAWNDYANMLRGIRHTGPDIVGVARVSFNPWAEITEKGVLPQDLRKHLEARMANVALIGHKVGIALNLDGGAPTVKALYGGLDENDNYMGDPAKVADNYARLIDATAAEVEKMGYTVVSAAPFNEPDYFWNGTPIHVFHEINKRLKDENEYPRFRNIRISGGNTLNCDEALPWYTTLKEYLDEGNTHQLAGDFDHYADFFAAVRADGKYATADELHNVMEAIVGVEYGMQTGIWWGSAEQTRGEFCKASGGDRLAYAENRDAWSAAAVYRNPSGAIQGFAGCSERQAKPSDFRFVSLEGDMYVNGQGPLREYVLSLPADPNGAYQTDLQRNAETMITITRGTDIQPVINGSYSLVNEASHKVMGARGASTANLHRIEQQTYTGGAHQLWTVEPVPVDIGGDFSYFFIRNTADGQAMDNLNWNLDAGGEVICYGSSGYGVQQWALEYDGDGWFHIRNRHSALYLEVANQTSGTLVLQQERKDAAAQRWRLIPAGVQPEFDAPAPPNAPLVKTNGAGISISWSPVAGATSYSVLRAMNGSDDFNTVARGLITTRLIDNSVASHNTYTYKIVAEDKSLNRSQPSQEVSVDLSYSGLIADYAFDGDMLDGSVNGLHARTLVDKEEYSTTDGCHSLRFRQNRRAQLPYSVMDQGNQFTVVMRACRLSDAEGGAVFSTGAGVGEKLDISLNSDGQLRVSAQSGDSSGELAAESAELRTWMHVALAVDIEASVATLYVDGKKVGESSQLAAAVPAHRILTYLGGGQDLTGATFVGKIDNLKIYNQMLGPEEIASLAGVAGISEINPDCTVVAEEYYTPNGIRLESPASDGTVTIVKVRRSDGSVTVEKRI